MQVKILLTTFFISLNIIVFSQEVKSNKIIIPEYGEVIAAALAHYPELYTSHIIFKETHINSTGKTTIKSSTLFSKQSRQYIIKINNNRAQTGFLLKDLTVNQQKAIIGHELAHVADFNHRNFFSMIGWGLSYLNKKHRKNIERATDLATINHGLGKELFEWSSFVLSSPFTTSEYKSMRRTFYMSPDEIQSALKTIQVQNIK